MLVGIVIIFTTCTLVAAAIGEGYDGGFAADAVLSSNDPCPSHSLFRRKTPLWIILGKHSPVQTYFKDEGDGNFSCLYQNKDYPGRPRRSDITLAYCHYDSNGNIDHEGSYPGEKGSHVDCPRRAQTGIVVPSKESRLASRKNKRKPRRVQ